MKKIITSLSLFFAFLFPSISFSQTFPATQVLSYGSASGSAATALGTSSFSGVAGVQCPSNSIFTSAVGTASLPYRANGYCYCSSCTSTQRYRGSGPQSFTCPTNSTVNQSTALCTPNSGFKSVYSGTFSGGIYSGGSWSVVATGSECTAPKVYNPVTLTCETPPPPAETNLVLASVLGVVGLAMAGAGVAVSTPLLIAAGLATTFHAALLAVGLIGSADTSTAEKSANVFAPITIELDPNKSLVSPAVNNGSAPKINKSSSNVLQPVGGDSSNVWSTSSDGKKTLTQTGSTGSRVVGVIDADGKTAVIYGSETKPVNTHVKVESDGSSLVAHGALVPSRNSSTGAATKVAVAQVHNFNSVGAKVSSAQYSNNLNQDASTVDPVTIGSGSGGDGSANSCGSMNCEATQQIIKNTLTDIKSELTKDADTTGLQAGKAEGEVNSTSLQASLMDSAPNSVKNFNTFQVVSHTSECPVLTVPFNGQNYTMDSHCAMADTYRPQMLAFMQIVWGFIAFMIVLGA